jgi:hypothetical protein
MAHHFRRKIMIVMTARRSAAVCALALALPVAAARATESDPTFSVDVVADCNRFISEGVGHPHPGPAFGDYFMQEGLIYEGGTLAANCAGGDGCGLNPDGTPEFPEAVIGKWTCYGSFVGNGGATAEGVWLYSTQVYEFDVEQIDDNVFAPGEHALITHGAERNDLNVSWNRAITGGYGNFKRSVGEIQQTKIGFNQTECENFTVDFRIHPRRHP